MQRPRIFVDFQNADIEGRVRLSCVGTVEDLNRLGIGLRNGLELTLCSHELEADGIVVYSATENLWVATIDWDKIRELPGNA